MSNIRGNLEAVKKFLVGSQFVSVYTKPPFYDPQCLFDVMDTYSALGRPIQITEITIPAYSNDPGDEEVQAEILRELYRI